MPALRARRTALAALAALPVVLGVLAGCQSDREAYCGTLADEQETLARLGGETGAPRTGVLSESIAVFERLRDDAPEDLAGDWDTFVRAWTALEAAMGEAGVDEGAFAGAGRPDGLSDQEFDAIQDAAGELRSPRVLRAAAGIEQHARDVCEVELSGTGLGP